MEDFLNGVKRVHFIGIGGSGMFPIVQILKQKGYEITGSDNNESDIVRLVKKLNIKVFLEQKASNIKNKDLIIYTSAILKNNEELIAAKKSGTKTIERNDFLAYFTKKYSNCIAICGTHGKTTTTAMLTQILIKAKKDPSAIIGGGLNLIKGYSCLGNSNTLVLEACEFKNHFLKLFADTVVVLNIDNDHLEYFKTMENLKNSFKKFSEKATNLVVYNGDDFNTKDALKNIKNKKVSFGFNLNNDFAALNIVKEKTNLRFDVYHKKELLIKDVLIKTPGVHNVLNALAAIVVALKNNVCLKDILNALKTFKGAKRRFELVGVKNGITVLDDYAHHPKEIFATLTALKDCNFKKIWAVHQPFTYSRTIMLKEEFKKALSLADRVIITSILASREKEQKNFTGKNLSDSIKNSVYIENQFDVKDYILKNAQEGDVVITMGCGDIYKAAKTIVFGKY